MQVYQKQNVEPELLLEMLFSLSGGFCLFASAVYFAPYLEDLSSMMLI